MRQKEKSNQFAIFLYNARLERGWSLREAGMRTGLEPSYINRLERGKRINPSVSTIQSLAVAFQVEMIDLAELVLQTLEKEKNNH
ncbi:helix-turn-helix domain-containing protein [Falsibacillus pallidus]|uniref:Helix-turn-helix protein n=1 Tax=Falsibacillus pallidus TaxID=493781 RepID=A0A370GCH6_9BACI|nr:helix-turn-helix transcriptional regulator [Falsibacillus pallidus]RDI40910.1 helix-turn-helix protein [Falsibacillus pallidus]